jgi:predicted amidohydrolase
MGIHRPGTLRIGLIQMRCEKGTTADNLKAIAGYLLEAAERDLDILAFPEMSLSGYADPGKFPQAVLGLDGPEVNAFLQLTRNLPTTVLLGLIEENPHGKPWITQVVVRQGQLLGFYHKITVKDEEVDWFTPGDREPPVFQHDGIHFGIAICADIDNEAVFDSLSRQGAQIVFECAAPGLYGEQATRDWQAGFEWWRDDCQDQLSVYARNYRLWIPVATQAGRTVDEDFPGGGYLFAPDGRCVYATPDWSPGHVYLELDLEHENARVLE